MATTTESYGLFKAIQAIAELPSTVRAEALRDTADMCAEDYLHSWAKLLNEQAVYMSTG